MKAEELMIGDWVRFPSGIDKVVDLPYIEGKGICASFAASATLFPIPVAMIEPIPLTPEILEKNGFVKREMWLAEWYALEYNEEWTDNIRVKFHDQFPWPVDWGDACIVEQGRYFSCAIHFIHELQHALKLCGINKEIVILTNTLTQKN